MGNCSSAKLLARGIETIRISRRFASDNDVTLFPGDAQTLLDAMPERSVQLVVTSPPYNIGKAYERKKKTSVDEYVTQQRATIMRCAALLKPGGSICWQIGNHVSDNEVYPIDIMLYPVFRELGLVLRNRIVWHFGHGLHTKRRFSGRYEVVMWYSKTKDYVFNLDPVRIPSKYPGKRHFKGPRSGELSGNPLGKNPEDVWFIPNCKLGRRAA